MSSSSGDEVAAKDGMAEIVLSVCSCLTLFVETYIAVAEMCWQMFFSLPTTVCVVDVGNLSI